MFSSDDAALGFIVRNLLMLPSPGLHEVAASFLEPSERLSSHDRPILRLVRWPCESEMIDQPSQAVRKRGA